MRVLHPSSVHRQFHRRRYSLSGRLPLRTYFRRTRAISPSLGLPGRRSSRHSQIHPTVSRRVHSRDQSSVCRASNDRERTVAAVLRRLRTKTLVRPLPWLVQGSSVGPQPDNDQHDGDQQDQHRPDVELLHECTVTPDLIRGLPVFSDAEEKAGPGSRPG